MALATQVLGRLAASGRFEIKSETASLPVCRSGSLYAMWFRFLFRAPTR
jgi:hypothetical protein